jgi:hypothetical protein
MTMSDTDLNRLAQILRSTIVSSIMSSIWISVAISLLLSVPMLFFIVSFSLHPIEIRLDRIERQRGDSRTIQINERPVTTDENIRDILKQRGEL